MPRLIPIKDLIKVWGGEENLVAAASYRLPPRHFRIFLAANGLKGNARRSYDEIAEEFDLSPNHVRSADCQSRSDKQSYKGALPYIRFEKRMTIRLFADEQFAKAIANGENPYSLDLQRKIYKETIEQLRRRTRRAKTMQADEEVIALWGGEENFFSVLKYRCSETVSGFYSDYYQNRLDSKAMSEKYHIAEDSVHSCLVKVRQEMRSPVAGKTALLRLRRCAAIAKQKIEDAIARGENPYSFEVQKRAHDEALDSYAPKDEVAPYAVSFELQLTREERGAIIKRFGSLRSFAVEATREKLIGFRNGG